MPRKRKINLFKKIKEKASEERGTKTEKIVNEKVKILKQDGTVLEVIENLKTD
jgi:hypothetical protein